MTAPVWGVPWHGRVQGGQLTLPNATTRAWPQPDGTAAEIYPADRSKWSPDHAGFTHLQKMPGVAAVVRTPEELAADQAIGMQWLDRAILAGASDSAASKSYLHSKPVVGWIYAAPDGSRWQIPGLGRFSWSRTSGVSLTMNPRRFGVLGGAAVMRSGYVALTNSQMGQASWSSDNDVRYCQMQAITPAGDKAIFMLYKADQAEWPMGFLLLTITGTPGVDMVMTLAPLRTAAQAAGTLTIDNAAATQSLFKRVDVTTTYEMVGGVYCKVNTYNGVSFESSDPGIEHVVSTGTNRLALVGRVIAMWFDDVGAPQEVTIDITRISTMSIPTPSSSYSGRDVIEFGTSFFYEHGVIAESWISNRVDADTFTLKFGAHSISFEFTQTVTSDSQRSKDNAGAGSTVDVKTVSFTAGTWPWSGDETVTRSNAYSVGSVSVESFTANYADLDLRPDQSIGGADQSYRLRIKRWANNLIGLVSGRIGEEDGAIVWSSAITTAGLIAGDSEQSVAVAATSPWYTFRPYGSWNPITGEAVIASATPISWT